MSTTTTDAATEDDDRGSYILTTCGILVGLSVIIVGLRTFVRAKMIRQVGADDWAMIFAVVVLFAEYCVIIPEVRYGAGRHVQYIDPPENVVTGLYLNFITQPLCLIALCMTKISVGLFLLRLTPSVMFRRFIIGTIIFTILSATGNFLVVFFQCQPLAYTWGGVAEGTCIPAANLKFAAFFNSSVSVLTDVVFGLLPIPMLWNVQMSWKIKGVLGVILSLGLFASVSAIIKITYLGEYGKHGDFLYDSTELTVWTTVEIACAIIAACIPCLKPLVKSIFEGTSAGAKYGSSKLKGYHHQPESSRTGAGASAKGQFEMYHSNHFTSGVKAGQSATGSEESILPENDPRSDGILKTTAVFVHESSASGSVDRFHGPKEHV